MNSLSNPALAADTVKVGSSKNIELYDFLNGHASLLTDTEQTTLLEIPSSQDMFLATQKMLAQKRADLQFICRICNPDQRQIIISGDKQTGHIIDIYTNPNGVAIDDIPDFVNCWDYSKEDLLIIYKKLLEMRKDSSFIKQQGDIEHAMSSIMHGKFSSKCQTNVSKTTTKHGHSTVNIVKCNKKIDIIALQHNPLLRNCKHCYE